MLFSQAEFINEGGLLQVMGQLMCECVLRVSGNAQLKGKCWVGLSGSLKKAHDTGGKHMSESKLRLSKH